MTTVQQVVLNNAVGYVWGTGHDWDNNKQYIPHSTKHIPSFTTGPFIMFVLCLGYPTGIGATLAFHDFCNGI